MSLATAPAEVMGAYASQNTAQRNTLNVRFYKGTAIDERATYGWSEERYHPETGLPLPSIKHPPAGIDKYREAVMVEIRVPGNTSEMRVREFRPTDAKRFPEEWAAFQRGNTNGPIGTPLEVVPFLTAVHVMELKGIGIATVENLRDCSDANGQKVMGFAGLQARARDFLAAAEGNAPTERLRKELEARDAQIAALTAQVQQIAEAQTKKRA